MTDSSLSNTRVQSNSSSQSQPLFLLIDGHSLAFRSYYAFAKGRDGGLRTSDGTPTSICFGFMKALLQVMAREKPDLLAVAFDLGLPTFRHETDETYKADRPETPDDFIEDLKNLQELLTALNLQIATSTGYEADDVLATLAKQGSEAGYRVKIVSGDRDLFQLIDEQKQIGILYFDRNSIKGSNNLTEYGSEEVQAKLGIQPTQVVDYKALCGDKSDNISGVKGIGEKTAVKLLEEYETLDNIYENLDQIRGATKKKLIEGEEDARASRFLAQLQFEVPIETTLDSFRLAGFNQDSLKPILERLQLKQFLRQINRIQEQFGGQVQTQQNEDEDNGFEDEALSFFSAEETEAFQQQETFIISARIVDTEDKLKELVEDLHKQSGIIAWDTETSDLKPRKAELVGIGCCWGNELTDVAYIPIGHREGNNLSQEQVFEALRSILENPDFPKALQNAKFDRLVFAYQGLKLAGVTFDPMLASYVLNPDSSHNLGDLAARYLPEIETQSYKDLAIPKGKSIADLDIPTVAAYCGTDAYVTYRLVDKLEAELAEYPALLKLFREVEIPLEPVLAQMEYWGIVINTDYLKELSEVLEQKLQNIEKAAYEAAGAEFNLNSPKQLSELLFDRLNLDRSKSRKTKTGYSTDHATLEKLRGDHPAIEAILEHRTLSKLKSTYVDSLPGLVDEKTRRIHTNFNQAVTATGRLSSSEPNLQNIPIRTEFARQIRKAFIPQQDWLLVSADYSQIELRILAHLSGEPILIDAYQNHRDVHTVTAQLLFEKEEITSQERRLGKTINFGVIYGMGAQRFAREAGVSAAMGKEFIARYRDRYPKVFEYLNSRKQKAIAIGYVETILERRRYFSFASDRLQRLKGSDPQTIHLDALKVGKHDSENLRAAANAPIQGSSADIIKIAMVNLHQLLQSFQARLLLQVHDELVFEVPRSEWQELRTLLKKTMENAVKLYVPLEVELRWGNNWMEMEEVKNADW